MQFGNPVAVAVDSDVGLDVVDLVSALVDAVANAEKRLIGRISGQGLQVHLKPARARVLLDNLARVAHRDQLGDRRQFSAAHDQRIVDAGGLVVDQELLRRDALDNVFRGPRDPTDAQADFRRGYVLLHREDAWPLAERCALRLRHAHKLDFGVAQNVLRLVGRQARIFVLLDLLIVAVIPRQDAVADNQGVLDGVVQDPEAGVLFHENVVDQVRHLLRNGHVFWPLWNKFDHFLAGSKDAQQRGDHGQDGVADLGHHDLRPPVLLVPEFLAQIVGHGGLAARGDIAVDIGRRVLDGVKNARSELVLVHRLRIAGDHLARLVVLAVVVVFIIGAAGEQLGVVCPGDVRIAVVHLLAPKILAKRRAAQAAVTRRRSHRHKAAARAATTKSSR